MVPLEPTEKIHKFENLEPLNGTILVLLSGTIGTTEIRRPKWESINVPKCTALILFIGTYVAIE